MQSLTALREEFRNATKTVLKENISKNQDTLNANCNRILTSYNNLINGIRQQFKNESKVNQDALKTWLPWAREKVLKSFEVLNCNYFVPPNFEEINPLVIVTKETASTSNQSFKQIQSESLKSDSEDVFEDTISERSDIEFNTENHISIEKNKKFRKMAELTPIDILKLVSTTINKNYSGDPLALQSFIDSVTLLKTIVTTEPLRNVLKQCILSKLEGKARECIVGETNTIDEIIYLLKTKIKSEKSQVIEGRMQALRADRVSLQDFSQKAEELAENLRRSLIMEGITPEKAQEITVEKTVQMCRASARSDLAKSVLASTPFKEAKDVVAKFVIEINLENQEKQVLSLQQRKGNFRGNNRRSYNNTNNSNNVSNNNQNYQNYNNRSNFNNYNNRGRNNFQSGRRNFRNDYNRNFNNSNEEPRYNNQNVRYLENQETPEDLNENQQEDYLGDNQN